MLEDKRAALETYLTVLALKYTNQKKFEAQVCYIYIYIYIC